MPCRWAVSGVAGGPFCWLRRVMPVGVRQVGCARRGRRCPWVQAFGRGSRYEKGADALLVPRALVSLYPAVPFPASPAAVPVGWPTRLAGAGIVAVRVTDLASPLREADRTALMAAGAGKIRTEDLVLFLRPVTVRRRWSAGMGRCRPTGIPLAMPGSGITEQRLDEMTGQPGVIHVMAAQAMPRGKVKGTARRAMTMAAAVRASLLMTLMPEAGYGEILSALFGDLVLLAWQAKFAPPTDTVLANWRYGPPHYRPGPAP